MSNYIKYYCYMSINAVITLFISGSIMQTFFAELGFSNRQIGSYTAWTNVVQIIVIALNIFIADNLKNTKKLLVWLAMSPILWLLPMFVFGIRGGKNTIALYYMAIFCGCVYSLLCGIKTIVGFRMPYMIIDIRKYALMENINGVISGIVSVLVSALVTLLLALYSMRSVMAGFFLLCILLSILSAGFVWRMKFRQEDELPAENKNFWGKMFKPEFRYFYLPNFLRGLAMGVISILPVICRTEITTSASVLSGLATVLSLSGIIGCAIYLALQYRMKTAKLYFLWSAVQCVAMILMMSGRNVIVFFICYMAVCVGYNITNVAVPVFVTEIVSYKDIGSYTSVRLIVMMGARQWQAMWRQPPWIIFLEG